jgi:hypothetical protein
MSRSLGGALLPGADYTTTGTWTGLNATGGTTGATGMTQRSRVLSNQAATVNLTVAQSGSVVLFDSAAGIIYTLPKPVVGLFYTFVVTVSITSNSAKVITDAATTFMIGSVSDAVAAGTSTQYIANGTTHLAITQNGAATGGLIGTCFYAYCVSSTLWLIDGVVLGTTATSTPFATS